MVSPSRGWIDELLLQRKSVRLIMCNSNAAYVCELHIIRRANICAKSSSSIRPRDGDTIWPPVDRSKPKDEARSCTKEIATPENVRKPRIYWYQTDVEVVTRIMLHDVEDYFLRVKTDEFEFSTKHEGVDYYVNLQLFGAVIADKTSHSTTGREITVHLPKVHKWADWPRLIYSSEKSTQIFVDVERLEAMKPKKQLAPTWDEKNFSSYKQRNRITQIMPDVPSSNEEDSADEGYNLIFE